MHSYTGWKVEDRPSSKIVFTFLKGKKIEEPLFNFDYDRVRVLTGTNLQHSSVRPKPGFGIRNRNQGPVLV